LLTITYGKGRIFHTVLGHAMGDGPHPAMQCVGFIVTFLRGAEWAATGKVTQKIPGDFPAVDRDTGTPDDVRLWTDYRPPDIKIILEDVAPYDYGKDEEVLSRLREYVRAHKGTPEAKMGCEIELANFLNAEATLAAKMAVCRHLREIGSAASVPVLGKMLLQPETSDMARYALEKIRGNDAERVLVQGLSRTDGKIRLGIIDSLGNRRADSAVSQLAKLLAGSNEAETTAAAGALGKIASKEAITALSNAMAQTSGSLKDRIASSLLSCADTKWDEGEKGPAVEIYEMLAKSDLPLHFRQSAMKGMIASSGDMAKDMIVPVLEGKNEDWYAPAISMLTESFDSSAIHEVLPFLPNLPAEYQIRMLQALSNYRTDEVRGSMVAAVENPESLVRIAALRALAGAGNYTVVEFLASHAAKSRGAELLAARNSLWNLRCGLAHATILTCLVKNQDEAIQHELILAIGERRIIEGLPLLLSRAQYGSERNRLQAIRGLKNLASPADLPQLADLLVRMKTESDQLEMAATIAYVASKETQPVGKARVVMEKLDLVQGTSERKSLIRTLGKIGDDSSLPALRSALLDENPEIKDAAVRALTEWPTLSAEEDLQNIARTSDTPVHKVLSLQAYIRMIGMEPYRSPASAVRSLKDVLDLARPEEKKMILGNLPAFASPEALELAHLLLQEAEVEAEARLAIEKIKQKLEKE
jgi:HEAT repeat protein